MLKKSLVSLLVGISIVGLVGCGESKVSKGKYDKIKNELLVQKTENAQNKNKIKGLNKENDKLREKIESAKNYLDLDENEKEIIDTKIDEVNKATEDQLAQEKQEQEEAKRVQEEKANSHIGETIKFTQSGCINPGDSYSFSFEVNGKKFVYATDIELKTTDFSSKTDGQEVFKDADVIVIDSQYTVEEVYRKENWGHSAFCYVIDFAIFWNIKKIFLFHHEPTYDDRKLDSILQAARWYAQYIGHSDIQIEIAKESLEVEL